MKKQKDVSLSKFLVTTLSLCMTIALFSTTAFAADNSLAQDNDGYYVIETEEDLKAVNKDLTGSYILANDIELTENWTPLGWIGADTFEFTGTFDGNGHTISNLTSVYTSSAKYVGLFAMNNGTIQNLSISVDGISAKEFVGAVAGWNGEKGIISNITVTQTGVIDSEVGVSGNGDWIGGYYDSRVGGIAGDNYGTVTSCSVKAQVMGFHYTGGITGYNEEGSTVQQSSFLGGVNLTMDSERLRLSAYVGGLVGMNDGSLQDCYVYTPTEVRGGNATGGAVGGNAETGTIANVYAWLHGVVSTDATDSGIFGGTNTGVVTDCFVVTSSDSTALQAGATRISSADLTDSETFMAMADAWDWGSVWKYENSVPVLNNCGVSESKEITIPGTPVDPDPTEPTEPSKPVDPDPVPTEPTEPDTPVIPPVEYATVTYKANSAEDNNLPTHMTTVTLNDDAASRTIPAGITINLPTADAAAYTTDNGWIFVFAGWSDGTNVYEPGGAYTVNEDVTLTPVWELISVNGDETWNIDDALTVMQFVQDRTNNPLTAEQLVLIAKVTGNSEVASYNIDTALTIMQKIQNSEL
jgi:hypothetical protein